MKKPSELIPDSVLASFVTCAITEACRENTVVGLAVPFSLDGVMYTHFVTINSQIQARGIKVVLFSEATLPLSAFVELYVSYESTYKILAAVKCFSVVYHHKAISTLDEDYAELASLIAAQTLRDA